MKWTTTMFLVTAAWAQTPARPAWSFSPEAMTAHTLTGASGAHMLLQNRDRSTEQFDREYEQGTRALDKRDWAEAVSRFEAAAAGGHAKADGALYWKAYALAKLGRGSEAQSAINDLTRKHPQSRWTNDAKSLSVEIAKAMGKPIRPEDEADEDVKLMAISSLVNTEPERSVPLLEKLLQGQSSRRVRERALFVLSQSESPQARDIVARIARGQANPDLQVKAVESLGVFGGRRNRQILSEIYSSSSDAQVKRQVLRSYMVAGEKDPLLATAKSDGSPEMRMHAIQLLGAMGARTEIAQLYSGEQSADIRARLLQAIHASGDTAKLIEVARSENDPKIRQRAIQLLGATNSGESLQALTSMYAAHTDANIRKQVIRALGAQGSAKQLIDIARSEKDVEMKKEAVQQLSRMQNKEATEYLMELLK